MILERSMYSLKMIKQFESPSQYKHIVNYKTFSELVKRAAPFCANHSIPRDVNKTLAKLNQQRE